MNIISIPDTAALQESLAYLPLATSRPGETVLAAGSKTGRLLFLKDGTVAVSGTAYGLPRGLSLARCLAKCPRCWTSRTRRTC